MSTDLRNALFVFSGALAGFLSGLMMPHIFGIRGAILGGAISSGVLFLNPWRKESSGQVMSPAKTIALSALIASIAFTLIWAYHDQGPRMQGELDLDNFNPIFASLSCLIYTAGLLLSTRARLAGNRKAWIGYLVTPILASLSRALSYGEIFAMLYPLFMGALPFVLLWLLAAWITDPAWSKQRWDRITQKTFPTPFP
jgi:hypothetical protein